MEMRYLLFILLTCFVIPAWCQGERDSTIVPRFKLTIEVIDLETDQPLVDARVKFFGSNGELAEFRTNDSGYVVIDTLIKPESEYTIEVSKKKYLTDEMEGKLKSYISTCGISKSMHYWKRFRLREVITCCTPPPAVVFKANTAVLETGAEENLQYYVTLLEGYRYDVEVFVSDEDLKLAKKRYHCIRDFMVSKGVDPARLHFKTQFMDPRQHVAFRFIEP